MKALLDRYAKDEVHVADLLASTHDPSAEAILYEDAQRQQVTTFGELDERSRALAAVLRDAGVQPGDRVAVLLPRSIDLVVAMVAIWRAGAVHVPLFTAFGPEAVGVRLEDSGSRVVITDVTNRPKIPESASLDHRFVVGGAPEPGDRDLRRELAASGERWAGVPMAGDDNFILLYTSGTTGHPKGVEIPVRALAAFESYMRWTLDLRVDDVYWNLADPGWAYGLWFTVIGPLLLGHRTILRNVPFDAEDFVDALERHAVTNLAGAPTVFRSLRAAGIERALDGVKTLQRVSTAGEPLNPELLGWSERVLGTPIHDHYGQSELGMPIGHHHHPSLARPLVPGTMGTAAPGFRPVVLGEDGTELEPGALGDLAIDTEQSALFWFRGYYQAPDRTRERFARGERYYLTGDSVRCGDGLFAFASRADDVITSAGYRIGPFEIESELMSHPAVQDVAVIGTPDDVRGEAVTAVVVLVDSVEPSDELAAELQQQVKQRLAAHLYPRHVVFRDSPLPRTPSGKVQRRLLRESAKDPV